MPYVSITLYNVIFGTLANRDQVHEKGNCFGEKSWPYFHFINLVYSMVHMLEVNEK